jgi:branched-chain amino acid transport system ATP-binding protein
MNASEKVELMGEIQNIKGRGYTIFMIEHDMRFVMGLCERIAVLNFGRIIAEGTPDQIRNDPQVIEAYLGRDDDDDVPPVTAEMLAEAGARSPEDGLAPPLGEVAKQQGSKP